MPGRRLDMHPNDFINQTFAAAGDTRRVKRDVETAEQAGDRIVGDILHAGRSLAEKTLGRVWKFAGLSKVIGGGAKAVETSGQIAEKGILGVGDTIFGKYDNSPDLKVPGMIQAPAEFGRNAKEAVMGVGGLVLGLGVGVMEVVQRFNEVIIQGNDKVEALEKRNSEIMKMMLVQEAQMVKLMLELAKIEDPEKFEVAA